MAYLVGLDLGQAQDYSALVIVEQRPTPPAVSTYAVRALHRWQLGTGYPTIEQEVARLLARSPLVYQSTLLVDYTGCGRPIVDHLRFLGLELQAVSLHGGDAVSHVGSNWRVPKRDLVRAVQLVLKQRRLQFAEALPLTSVLTRELLDFRVKIDPATAHDSYSAWREKDHDDLVLALALPLWWAERGSLDRLPVMDLSRGIQGLRKASIYPHEFRTHRIRRGDYPQLDWDA